MEHRWRALVALLLLTVGFTACGDDADDNGTGSPASTTVTTAAEVAPSAPELSGGPPSELPAGEVTTVEGADPTVTFTVPDGWFGSGGTDGFGIGKGLDTVAEDFADVGIFVHVLDSSVDEAVTGFSGLADVEVAGSTPAQIDGRDGTTVEARITGERAVLEPIGVRADIPRGSASVTFVDVDGRTLMISVQLWRTDADKAEALAVVESFRFG